MPNTVDLGPTIAALGTDRADTKVRAPLDAATAQKLEATIDQFRTETLNQVREWLAGRASPVTAEDAADLIFSPASLKLLRAAEHFVTLGLVNEAVEKKIGGLSRAEGMASVFYRAVSDGSASRRMATSMIPKLFAKLETLGATYGKKWAANLEADLPSLRQRHATTDFPQLMRSKLEKLGYGVTDAHAATLGAKAEAISKETMEVMEQLIAGFKSGNQPAEIAALLKIVAEGAISMSVGLDELATHKGQTVDPDLERDVDHLIHEVGGVVS
jgi:hypothetical protein